MNLAQARALGSTMGRVKRCTRCYFDTAANNSECIKD